ncbi:SusD/RagB family nutrient-binding outer membrane lipoprotein [Bacteroidota bacterium]
MKTNIYIKTILLLITLSLIFSCDKWIDPDINIDPDSPEYVTMDLLLASSQVSMAYVLGGINITGVTSMWMKYIEGFDRQTLQINNYIFLEKDVNNQWTSIYTTLKDLKLITELSQEEGKESPHYEGIAKILMAFTFGTATQLWGDIPFSEALQGDAELNPAYDSQEYVYTGIQQLLDEAIIALNIDEDSNYYDIEGDLIYESDIEKWKKAAYTLKLRYYLHLSKVNNNAYSTIVNMYNEDSLRFFTSNEDDLELYFGKNETEQNPMFQFDEDRTDCVSHPYFDSLQASKQPAIREYTPQSIWPVYLIAGDNEPFAGTFYGERESPVTFISYAELQFIIAEARLKQQDSILALSSLKKGVLAFLEKLTSETDIPIDYFGWMYEYQYQIIDRLDNYDQKIEEIMTQKYIATFLNPEAFVDWRRTGYPVGIEKPSRTLPRRFPYSSEERLYNQNIPATSSIFARNWFDPE